MTGSSSRALAGRRPRRSTVAIAAITAVLLLFMLLELSIILAGIGRNPEITIGMDLRPYLDATRTWLDGGSFYLPRQLTGEPYVIESGDILYPPTTLYLLVPFAVGLPLVLWWAIPIAATAAALIRMRPALWGIPLIAVVGCYPRTWTVVILGNLAMWTIAAAVAGVAWGWPAVGALLKPTMAPFALVGAHRRSWRIGLIVIVVASLPFGAMWLDFITVVANAENDRSLEYPLGELPIVAALVLAAASRPLSARMRVVRPSS